MLFSLSGDCLAALSSNFKFSWQVSVNFLTLVAFICSFSLERCEEMVVRFLHSDTSVAFFSRLHYSCLIHGCERIYDNSSCTSPAVMRSSGLMRNILPTRSEISLEK